MEAASISLSDELLALAAQCDEQASLPSRAEDRAFIQRLASAMFAIGGCDMLDRIARMIADASDPLNPERDLKRVIRQRAEMLRGLAGDHVCQSGDAA